MLKWDGNPVGFLRCSYDVCHFRTFLNVLHVLHFLHFLRVLHVPHVLHVLHLFHLLHCLVDDDDDSYRMSIGVL